MSLKPYHNPENVDESRVPDGWRFLYADEVGKQQPGQCDVWLPWKRDWSYRPDYIGNELFITYIVPVNA